MAESIFGTPADPVSRGGEGDTPAWLKSEEPTTEPSAVAEAEGSPAEAAPEATPEPATEETQATSTPGDVIVQLTPEEFAQLQAAQEAQAAAGTEGVGAVQETPEERAERLYANKYRSVEDLEKGYGNARDMWRRAMEAKQAEEAARLAAEQRLQQFEASLRSAIPMLEQASQRERAIRAWAEQYRAETGTLPPGMDPAILTAPTPGAGSPAEMVDRASVEQMLEQRLAAERAEMAAQFARQQEADALARTVNEFYNDHPEVEPYGALDNEITDVLQELAASPAWQSVPNGDGSFGIVVDPTDRGSLDVVYEAVQRPALLEILKLRPDYFTSEAGLQIARRDASLLEGVPPTTEPQTATVPASRAGTRAGQKVPFVESAQGSVPQNTSPDMADPWERIKAVDLGARRQSGQGKKPVFFE